LIFKVYAEISPATPFIVIQTYLLGSLPVVRSSNEAVYTSVNKLKETLLNEELSKNNPRSY